LIGQTTSQAGSQVSAIAIPLLAVVALHADAFQVGLLGATSTIAFAVIGLPAGAWVDRLPRRPVLVASDIVRAVVLAWIPVAWLLGVLNIAQLLVVSLVVGFARVFFDVGYRSYIPTVIGVDRVLAGNSSMEFVRASGQVAGPGLGGALVSLLGAANVVGVQALSFAVSAGCLLGIRTRERMPSPASQPRQRLARDIADGVGYVFRTPVLRATALASGLSNLSFAVASAVNIIFLSRVLELSPTLIGIVIAIGALAAMGGAAFAPRLAALLGQNRLMWLSLAVTAPLGFLVLLAQPGWLTLLGVIGMVAGEFGQIVYSITNVSVRQQICPERMLGRVNATMQVLVMGLFPLGAIVGGVLGEAIGPRLTLAVAALIVCAAPVPLYLTLRRVRACR
jgi:MFS family permease